MRMRRSLPTIKISATTGLPEKPFLVQLSERVAALPPWIAYGLSYGLLIGFLMADHVSRSWLGLSRLSVVPVCVLAWSRGRTPGIVMSVVAVMAWMCFEPMRTALSVVPAAALWNVTLRLGVLVACAAVLTALKEAILEEKELARTDELTGVANRRWFLEWANQEIKRAKRYGRPFVVAYLDIDNFKAVNDRYGHNQGDALLRLVAQTARRSLREVDFIARLGGDEFAVLLPETAGRAAEDVIRKVQKNLGNAMREHAWPVTFSIGIVAYELAPVSVDEMIKTADRLMYAGKHGGKNTIRFETVGAPA